MPKAGVESEKQRYICVTSIVAHEYSAYDEVQLFDAKIRNDLGYPSQACDVFHGHKACNQPGHEAVHWPDY